ncbi:MFS transporter [Candidatus Hakubella thermalkaliphila]|nr:MFS transporter [Candidatus Hakubella thermalkaliphila]
MINVLYFGKIPLSTPFYQGLLYAAIIGIPVAGLLLLPYAILADIIDYDGKQTGLRREAMYMGVQGLITKGAIAFASVIATQILSKFGSTFDKPFGIYLCGPVAALFTLIGFIIFLHYPFRE